MKPSIRFAFILAGVLSNLFVPAQQNQKTKEERPKTKTQNVDVNSVSMQTIAPLDTLVIERIMGMKGKSNNGEYKITVPQNDLSIEVHGFKIIPAMGLSTWIAFTPIKDGTMIMGD